MSRITITPATRDGIRCHYKGQINPQPVAIYLDVETGTMSAAYNPEIGNAITFREFHGITRRYPVPDGILVSDLNALMRACRHLAQRVVDGASVEWDGSNHVARLTADAELASEGIDELCYRLSND